MSLKPMKAMVSNSKNEKTANVSFIFGTFLLINKKEREELQGLMRDLLVIVNLVTQMEPDIRTLSHRIFIHFF